MKKEIFIMLIILSLTGLLHSQELFEQIKLTGPSGQNLPQFHVSSRVLIETYDSGYLVLSNCIEDAPYLQGSSVFGVLSKYNINGELLWTKDFDKGVYINSFVELKDGSTICAGGILKKGWLVPQIWAVFKLNPCGEFEWGKQIDHSNHKNKNYITDNALDVGDGIIITAFKEIDDFTDIRDRIKSEYVKLDYDGNLLWRRDLKFSINSHQCICGSCVDMEGNIMITGQITVPYPWGSTAGTQGTFIAKTDRDGNVLYEAYSGKNFQVYNLAWNAPVVDKDNIAYSSTEDGWYAGEVENDMRVYAPLYVSDANANTTFTYEIKCDDAVPAEEMYIRRVSPFSMIDDYEHIVTAVAFKNKEDETSDKKINVNDDGYLFRVFAGNNMKTSNILKSEKYNSGNEVTVRLLIIDKKANELLKLDIPLEKGFMEAVVTTKDNNIVVLTNNNDANDRYADSYLMKYTNKLTPALINHEDIKYDTYCDRKIESGYVKVNFDDLIIDEVQEIKENICDLRLSPNPATNRLYINFSDIKGNKQIEVFNLSGQKIRNLQIEDGLIFQEIDITELKSGLYFVKLMVDEKYITTQKLIIK